MSSSGRRWGDDIDFPPGAGLRPALRSADKLAGDTRRRPAFGSGFNTHVTREIKLRKKWKYLRDQFSVELGKMPPYRSDAAALAYEPKWPYFQPLLFLKEVVTPRSSGNFPKPTLVPAYPHPETSTQDGQTTGSSDSEAPRVTASPSDDDNGSKGIVGGNDNTLPSTPYPTIITEKSRKRMRKEKLKYWIKKSKKQKRQEEEDDEHLYFFKSILPHVRKINQHILLSFRSRIQEVVEEFAYRSTLSFASPPNSMYLTEPTIQDTIQNHVESPVSKPF